MKVLRIKIKFKIQNNKNEINTVNYFLLGALKVHNFNNFKRILHYAILRTVPFFHRTCNSYVILNRRLWVIILLLGTKRHRICDVYHSDRENIEK